MTRDDWHNWLKKAANWQALPWWLALAGLASGAYLAVAGLGYGVAGFPLDDAWIHQTYARNLAATGQWAFVPGQTSAGSTAPLWSLLLSLGYWVSIPYQIWTYALGILALGLTGWTVARLGATLFPAKPWVGPAAGLLCVWEWHLVWAAVSGMETIWYIWLSVVLVKYQISNVNCHTSTVERRATHWIFDICDLKFAILGFVGGLLTLTRPEGLVLFGLIGLATGWQLRRTPVRLLRTWAAMVAGLALLLLPYLAFHYALTGLPFPNTFYAKQEEYRAALILYPFWQRWLMMVGVTLVGGQVLLLPGFVYGIWRAASNLRSQIPNLKSAPISPQPPASNFRPPVSNLQLLPAVWWFAHLTFYALRLPVTYQHGRYQMPVIPFFILLGLGGTAYLLQPAAGALLPRVVSRAMLAATTLVSLIFLGLGARAYATDVAFIQGEMIATARWLEEHVPPNSLIAVHDIGAVGYFTPRPLLDLAGLATPEVIPFITDEVRLIEFMQGHGADYVVFFPDWSDAYQRMAQDPHLEPVHTTGFAWTLNQGRANMTVYRLRSR